jgi:predicted dehydrogenase
MIHQRHKSDELKPRSKTSVMRNPSPVRRTSRNRQQEPPPATQPADLTTAAASAEMEIDELIAIETPEYTMSRHNRRDFLSRAAVGGLAAAGLVVPGTDVFGRVLGRRNRGRQSSEECGVAQAKPAGRVLGANDRVRIAMAGVNSRGREHLQHLCSLKNVEIAYLVDPDTRTFKMAAEIVKRHGGGEPRCVQDLRKALDDKQIDAVSIAAPNHWHTLLAIWACQAGKDVYVEKPCSHTLLEGRKLVEAARKYDRIVQHGTQSRSDPNWIAETAAVRSGKYGRLLVACGYASKTRRSIGFKPAKQPPAELDFDIWLGPAPRQPYHENIVHYNWHWFWDFGNGEIGNQGVHQMDIARWAMPEGAVPKNVLSLGGRFGYKDQGQTPNTQLTIIDFGGPKIFFEDRGLVNAKSTKVANEFYTDLGVIKQGKFFARGKKKGEPLPAAAADLGQHVSLSGKVEKAAAGAAPHDPTRDHFANFIDCVRSHRREDLHADILEGHRTALLCHLGNISYQLGTETPFADPIEALAGDVMACEAWGAMKQHLADAGVTVDGDAYRLGRKLAFDAEAERFIGDPEADRLLTRTYRNPYVVPTNV